MLDTQNRKQPADLGLTGQAPASQTAWEQPTGSHPRGVCFWHVGRFHLAGHGHGAGYKQEEPMPARRGRLHGHPPFLLGGISRLARLTCKPVNLCNTKCWKSKCSK